ncbi:hypothetical protein AVEN_6016-1 [Araneus ventricosus]|uniref:Uncharacterized protein n=1 Tax=Araneus ventricosus TaxID=182803 RepID=A0A4Y2K4U6_ARAVE|nr:hypothetical protein AVEN_6016-1 [Araneus ventricosus]
MRPQENKIRAVQESRPQRPKQTCSWDFARGIYHPSFSNIAAPLYHLTNTVSSGGDLRTTQVPEQLKNCLTHAPVLALPKEDAAWNYYIPDAS